MMRILSFLYTQRHTLLILAGSLALVVLMQDISLADIPKPNYVLGTGESDVASPSAMRSFFLNGFIPKLINYLLMIVSLGSFATLLWSSFRMLTAWGNETALENAKNGVRFSVIGLLLAIFSYALVALVANLALPNQEDSDSSGGGIESSAWHFSPFSSEGTVYASNDLELLLPSAQSMVTQSNEDDEDADQVILSSGDLLTEIIPSILSYFYYAIAFIIFISLSYAGGRMVLSRGNEESLTFAKEVLLYSAIGAVLAGLSFALVTGLGNLNFTQDRNSNSDTIFPANSSNTLDR